MGRGGVGGGAGTQFFGGYVPHGFPKVGSGERPFPCKMRGLGSEKIRNFTSLRDENWPKTR